MIGSGLMTREQYVARGRAELDGRTYWPGDVIPDGVLDMEAAARLIRYGLIERRAVGVPSTGPAKGRKDEPA